MKSVWESNAMTHGRARDDDVTYNSHHDSGQNEAVAETLDWRALDSLNAGAFVTYTSGQ